MGKLGLARGPKRAGPVNPGPRALRAETGLIIFYLRFLLVISHYMKEYGKFVPSQKKGVQLEYQNFIFNKVRTNKDT